MTTPKPYTYAEGTRDAMTMTPSYFILARKVQKWWLERINTTPALQAEKVVLEALELEADPSDLDEMADVFITILGLAAARYGHAGARFAARRPVAWHQRWRFLQLRHFPPVQQIR